jgi:hypothetical protein
MGFQIDKSMHWAEHFVEYGFCVIKGALSQDFCKQGIAQFAKALGTDLPPQRWTTEELDVKHSHGRVTLRTDELQSYLDSVYDQPGIRDMFATMFGSIDNWNGQRAAGPFLCLFDPANKREVMEWGHVDFLRVRIPVIGNAFVFQSSLIDTEPFSGNITIYPGWHKIVQKRLLDDPTFWYADDGDEHAEWCRLVPKTEPYEFVAEAGDVLLMQHLVGHAGNSNAATNHTPRVAIHSQAIMKQWVNEIDPADPTLCPYHRSMAHNGHIKLPYNEADVQAAAYKARRERFAAAR